MDQARRALQKERNEDAQAILINVIAREPEHEEAWILLAEAITDASKKRECLERARVINPRNRAILRALERLDAQSPPPPDGDIAEAQVAPGFDPSFEFGSRPADPPPPADDSSIPPESIVSEIIATPIRITPPLPPTEIVPGPVEPVLEQAKAVAQGLLLTTDPARAREHGCELLCVLDEAIVHDLIATRTWARTVGRAALLKYEMGLTATIADLAPGDPQLAHLREQRHRALSYLR